MRKKNLIMLFFVLILFILYYIIFKKYNMILFKYYIILYINKGLKIGSTKENG